MRKARRLHDLGNRGPMKTISAVLKPLKRQELSEAPINPGAARGSLSRRAFLENSDLNFFRSTLLADRWK